MNTQNRNDDPNREQDANRDPLTGEPGSHPVGTGAGAIAGGAAAGAATGTVAGPVGTGIGAAAGAVAGGLAGKGAAEHFNPTEAGQLERFIDYTVIDRDNDKIGSVDAVWEDHTGQPAYLAVRTGWLGFGKAHVVPAQDAEVNEDKKRIRLPYTKEQVKNAPSFDSQEDITEDSDFTISSHFGTRRSWTEKPITQEPARTEAADMPRAAEAVEQPDANIKLREEALRVGKREVEYGGVRLRKIVRTEKVNQPVELAHEEIVIERVPASGSEKQPGQPIGNKSEEQEIYIPLRREEAVVEKTTRTREEVHVGKRREKEQETVHEELRHEDVEIEHEHEEEHGSMRDR
jgi:uncharacterized protein (TIGR02271 family)